ncbi:hypothetical protein AMJ52_07195 [candidate division TA06 bacterium DG_78]|uniref:Uncharacterized protein n=1 Tax=candidate division TA06 bacterium DG_78 TaxID=1703772 RepID=A0A0S7YC56_UNCT6|nr:MAG: hypothetical protein AMJ52_07195 [candidate division TA06 bacterium DG_78]
MRYIANAVILCFGLVGIANAQWLETTIYLPDNLGSMGSPWCLAYNSTSNAVYTGGGGGYVFVIDGETNQRIARIAAGLTKPSCPVLLSFRP